MKKGEKRKFLTQLSLYDIILCIQNKTLFSLLIIFDVSLVTRLPRLSPLQKRVNLTRSSNPAGMTGNRSWRSMRGPSLPADRPFAMMERAHVCDLSSGEVKQHSKRLMPSLTSLRALRPMNNDEPPTLEVCSRLFQECCIVMCGMWSRH